METRRHWFQLVCFCVLSALSVAAQFPEAPSHFKLDMETAARLRPQLLSASVAASGRHTTGRLVFERLVSEAKSASSPKLLWQLRIVEDDQLNAYASPDGTVYVESGLADLAGSSSGLWAAILSHEISHVVRRDWARRYLFQKQLEGAGGTIVLGDPGLMSGEWTDSGNASAGMGRFCRQMEVDADRAGLLLMARAGYHPDFVPALHHLLHARESGSRNASLYAMHPCWEERDRELGGAYQQASIEFEHRWQEWYASPGGNPPVVVFADPPSVKKTGSRQWEIHVTMSCQNLAGAVEVVLRADPKGKETANPGQQSFNEETGNEVRQLTGCTSPRTMVSFTAADLNGKQPNTKWTDVYVIDAWGSVLARADLPKLPR